MDSPLDDYFLGGLGAASTFTFRCKTCGFLVKVLDGKEESHRCRIDLDAQKGR